MKLIEYPKIRKNRYTLIAINIIISLLLSFLAVYLDGTMGSESLVYIYILQVVCFANWAITFFMILWNIYAWAGQKKRDRDNRK